MPEEEEESLVEEEDSLEVEEDSEGDVLEQEELEEEEDSVLPRTVSLRRVSRTTRTYSSMPEYSDSEEETLLKMICWNIFMMHSYQFLSILILKPLPLCCAACGPRSHYCRWPAAGPCSPHHRHSQYQYQFLTTLSTQPRDIMDPA